MSYSSYFIFKFGIVILFYILLSIIVLETPKVEAQKSMSNDFYIIKLPNLNSFSGKTSDSLYKLNTTGGQTAPGLFTGNNFRVKSGFAYIKSTSPFTFSVSSTLIDFGPISPGSPITRTNNLTVTSGAANGYSVLASQDHALKDINNNSTIPDTTCDSGTCNESLASVWSSLTTYGFGYRCDNIVGSGCASGFGLSTNFKQFASEDLAESAQPIMNGTLVVSNTESRISYKVNIASSQNAGNYESTITYIALPSL